MGILGSSERSPSIGEYGVYVRPSYRVIVELRVLDEEDDTTEQLPNAAYFGYLA